MADDETYWETVPDRVRSLLGHERYVYLVNKDVEGDCVFAVDGQRLPHSPEGLNEFKRYHNAVVLPAYLLRPSQFRFLAERAHISREEVRRSIVHEKINQAVSRTSARDPGNTNRKKFIVPDMSCAEWVARCWPGARTHLLDGDVMPQHKSRADKKHETSAAKTSAYRKSRRERIWADLAAVNGCHVTDRLKETLACHETHNGSFFSSLTSVYPFATGFGLSDDSLIHLMRERHTETYANKEDNLLFCPAVFDGSRAKDNVVAVRGIWLDNDGGGMQVADFVEMFPRWQMVIYNTFSSTTDNPRWRVFIPPRI